MTPGFWFGEWVDEVPLAETGIDSLIAVARRRSEALSRLDHTAIAGQFAALRPQWARGGAWRRVFLETGPEHSLGLSTPMLEWGLDRLVLALDAEVALGRVTQQLGSATGEALRFAPLGVVLHVVSGNVFIGPAESLLAGLLTRNVGIVKRPSGAGAFLDCFCRSLAEAAPELAAGVAVLGWRGGRSEVEGLLVQRVDAIVVAGDVETIGTYRRLAPAHKPLVEFGPRASVAVVSRAGATELDLEGLARDVALWDQLACTAAQCVYVEGDASDLAGPLAAALERLAGQLPEGEADLDERIEVARFRDLARLEEALGRGRLWTGSGLASVALESERAFRPSSLRRCVRLKPYRDLAELSRSLLPARDLLQTVGLAVAERERKAYSECVTAAGARRVCRVGSMNEPDASGLRDGVMELQRLVRWVEAGA